MREVVDRHAQSERIQTEVQKDVGLEWLLGQMRGDQICAQKHGEQAEQNAP
jgi:hypothetical protein